MSTTPELQLSSFASDVLSGLGAEGQKKLNSRYFYDDLGSKLFEAITLLPEYGLTRADSRILSRCAGAVARVLGSPCFVAELGSGSGKKTSHILSAIQEPDLMYYPIDVSSEALSTCWHEINGFAAVEAIHADYFDGLAKLSQIRPENARMLLLFLGSSIGNFEPPQRKEFFAQLHRSLRPDDLFLLGADLVKEVDRMIAAYDDPTGVTAAFNLNLLGRINRELDADFDLNEFQHHAMWNERESRMEMHMLSRRAQKVRIGVIDLTVDFAEGESIWTESSHKFTRDQLEHCAVEAGFRVVETWVDKEWSFAETLWQV
jgi:L-histidine N-alpha-methyltransferase